MKIRSEWLDRRVSLVFSPRPGDANDFGEEAEAGQVEAKIWANIKPLGGSEFFRASRIDATATHLVTIRYREGMSTDKWIVWGGRRLNIISFAEVGRREGLELTCREQAR